MTKTENPGPKTNEVAAIVLAAGQSQRMGAFKPLLPFGSKTVIEAAVQGLRTAGIDSVVVVIGRGGRADELKEHLKGSGIIFAVNPDSTSEMSVSIACGVREMPASAKAVVITPADHPAVPARVVKLLVDEWKDGAKLVMPTHKGRGGHPVLVDLSFRNELLDLDTAKGLRSLFDAHRQQMTRVAVDSDYIARDMDTWDDYIALHHEVFGVPPR